MGKGMTGIERLRDIAYDGPYSGGMVHISVQRLREICEQVVRETEDISGSGSDALAWVEEHGGLEELKKRLDYFEGASAVSSDRSDRLAGWLDDIEAELFGERIETFAHGDDERQSERMSDILKAVEGGAARLVPEGLEWPRFEDGALVDFGDEVAQDDGDAESVDKIVFYGDQWRLYDRYGCEINEDMMGPGERVKRPASKVLDADGVEIRLGDKVWNVDSGMKFTVDGLPDRLGYCGIRLVDGCGSGFCYDPDQLTHKRPEIDRCGLSDRDVSDVISALLAGCPGVDADWLDDIAAQVCSALGIRAYGKQDGAR